MLLNSKTSGSKNQKEKIQETSEHHDGIQENTFSSLFVKIILSCYIKTMSNITKAKKVILKRSKLSVVWRIINRHPWDPDTSGRDKSISLSVYVCFMAEEFPQDPGRGRLKEIHIAVQSPSCLAKLHTRSWQLQIFKNKIL